MSTNFVRRLLSSVALLSATLLLLFPDTAQAAACDTTGTDAAWGDFWVERSSTCECLFFMRKYGCVADPDTHARSETAKIEVASTKLTPGDCSKPCEAMSGYWSSVATVRAQQVSEYACDTALVDLDQDGYGSCLDQNWNGSAWVSTDDDPRLWVETTGVAERECDSRDNDQDGTVDDGLSGCTGARDHKRVGRASSYQGDGASSFNVVEGSVMHRTTDISIEGPFGPLPMTRYYDSRRELDDCGLGKGWTHQFCVLLRQMMNDGDTRYQVQKANGDTEYFRCFTAGDDLTCTSDDRKSQGWLRRTGTNPVVFTYYVGDGTYYTWQSNSDYASKRLYYKHFNESGNVISYVQSKSSEKPTRVESANSSIFLYFTAGTYGVDLVQVSSADTATNEVLDFDIANVSGSTELDLVKFAPTLGDIDSTYKIDYTYDSTSRNLLSIKQNIDGTYTDRTVASFTYDSSDRALTLQDATKDLDIDWIDSVTTDVTYTVGTSNAPTVRFTHNGLFVGSRNSDIRQAGMTPKSQEHDDHGRVSCARTNDNRTIKPDFTASMRPIEVKFYNANVDATCASPGTLNRTIWYSWEFGGNKGWRVNTIREKSVFNPATSCSSADTGCLETDFDYTSSADDRISKITVTGNSKETDNDVIRPTHVTNYYYYPDTTNCPTGGVFDGLACRIKETDGTNTLGMTDYLYVVSGSATSGLLKSTKRHDKSSDPAPLTTVFADATYLHTIFGSPSRVVSEAGVATDLTYNGWNAVTAKTEKSGLLTDALPPSTQDRTWSYSYNKLRRLDTVTLPKTNKLVHKYFTASTGEYARTKAYATADASGNLLEIKRYEYDKFGRRTEEKIIDSISNTNDEDHTTWEVWRQSKYNARGQLLNTYLHAADTTGDPDGTATYSYTNGQLTTFENYLLMDTVTVYDAEGRVSTVERDDGGISATTTYTYDVHGRVLTTSSPTSVVTRTEYDDHGRLVLERSQTRGDIRFEYNAVGHLTKRLRSSYDSTSNSESTCYTNDWLGRRLTVDISCNSSADWDLYHDGDSLPASSCPTGTVQTGRLSTYSQGGAANMSKVLCYHPNGMLYSAHQRDSQTFSNSAAKGTTRIYDLNGNVVKEYLHDRPDGHTHARELEYSYHSDLKDRVSSVRHRLTSAGSWTAVTDATTLISYFPFGSIKSMKLGNGIVEGNTRDKAYRLLEREAVYGGSTDFIRIELAYDVGGNITFYDETGGSRQMQYYAAYDKLNRLRCWSRTSISSCTGAEPWEDKFLESFAFDASGNRTNRRYGAFDSTDDDAYTYVASTDIIDKVTSGGTDKQMSNSFRGEITQVNQPERVDHTFDLESRLATTNDNFLGSVSHYYTQFMDRFKKVSVCNSRKTLYYYTPTSAGGTSHEPNVINMFNTCLDEYPRQLRSYIYLEGRPIAVAHSEIASSSSDAQSNDTTFYILNDQLGTPIMVTEADRDKRWMWENDPFGHEKPIEYGVSTFDVNPDDATGSPYNTCCCATCCTLPSCSAPCTPSGTCGGGTAACCAGCCSGGTSQAVVWTKTYTPSSATNVRVHFSAFNVTAGTTRTGKDYLTLYKGDGTTVVSTLTGNLGAHWSAWSNDAGMVAKLTSDYSADQGSGSVTIDKLEYTTDTGRYVMHLRMPGQIYDEDALANYNYHRWYRPEDGRYLSPDPIGLKGGEAGYFAYVNSGPVANSDPSGLSHVSTTAEVVVGIQTVHCGTFPNRDFFEPPPTSVPTGADAEREANDNDPCFDKIRLLINEVEVPVRHQQFCLFGYALETDISGDLTTGVCPADLTQNLDLCVGAYDDGYACVSCNPTNARLSCRNYVCAPEGSTSPFVKTESELQSDPLCAPVE